MKRLNDINNNNKDYIDVDFTEVNEKNKKVKAKIVKEKGGKREKFKKSLENAEYNYNYYKSLPVGFRKFVNCVVIVTVVGGSTFFTINKLKNENNKLKNENHILANQREKDRNTKYLAEQNMINKFEQINKDNLDIVIEHQSTILEDEENKPLEYIYTKKFENDLWGLFDTEITLPYRANAEYELRCDLSNFDYVDFDFDNNKLRLGVNKDKIYLVNYDTTKEEPTYVRMVGEPIKISDEELKQRGIKEYNWAAVLDSSSEKELIKTYRSEFEKHYTEELLIELKKDEERLKQLVIDKVKSLYEVIGLKVEVEITEGTKVL